MISFEKFATELSDHCLDNCPEEYRKALWMWGPPRKKLSEIQFYMKFVIGVIPDRDLYNFERELLYEDT